MVRRALEAAQHGGDGSRRLRLDATAFLTAWTILGLNILSPGPNVLNTITTAMGSGRGPALAAAAAVGVGSGLWCLGMSLGMAVLFQVVPGVQEALTIMAAGLLIYFATRYLRAAFHVETREKALRARAGLGRVASFWRSFSIVATNPKALTTWLAILGILPLGGAAPGDIAILCLGAVAISALIHAVYGVLFSTGAAAVLYLRAAPVVNAAVGLFFASFAIRLVAPLLARV